MQSNEYEIRIGQALESLGISMQLIMEKRLPFCREAQELVIAETDVSGRDYLLEPEAAHAWWDMKEAARRNGIVIEIVSAFRDVDRQVDIIRRKLERGMPIEQILTLSAPPGYSEHHTGRAVDINTPGCAATEEEFDRTDAYRWLTKNAKRFRFTLSYPRNNALGFIYEPWHWCYQPVSADAYSSRHGRTPSSSRQRLIS